MKKISLLLAFCGMLCGCTLFAAPPSYLILIQQDTMKNHFNAAFSPSRELKKELDKLGFVGGMAAVNNKLTLEVLKQYNVVVIGVDQSDFKLSLTDAVADKLGALLAEYAKLGGGVYFTRNGGYQFGRDIVALNRMLKYFDAKMYNEQIVDRSKTFNAPASRVYWTGNITPGHPVTEGVKGLFYPEPHGPYPCYTDFTSPLEVGKDWTILARGSDTAWSFEREKAGKLKPEGPGHFKSAPPFVAARSFGKGRVVIQGATAPLYWEETHHPFWCTGKLMEGTYEGKPADGLKLTVNIMRYLAEPSKGVLGGFNSPWKPGKQGAAPEPGQSAIDWDSQQPQQKFFDQEYIGLLGVQSTISGGKGTPQEFIEAAQNAGYNYLAFAEDFAKLTPEKFAELKKICAAAAKPGFRAYPGFRYVDETGCSWMVFSDKVTYPPADWISRKMPGRIINNNPISRGWNWPPVILLNSNSNPQKPYFKGNFKFISVYTYDKDNKLTDDGYANYRYLANNRFIASAACVRLLDDPAKVAEARKSGFQNVVRWPDEDVVKAYTGRYCDYKGSYVWFRPVYLSEGPAIEDLSMLNFGTSDLAIRGNDRIRLHFRAASDAGIKEVILHDGDKKAPLRRFDAGGKKLFSVTFDMFHTDRRAIIPEVIDVNGKRAIGFEGWTSIQENEYGRCTDNINTWHVGKWWGSPKGRHNMRSLEDYMVARNFIYHGTPIFAGLGDEGHFPRVEYRKVLSSRYALVVECLIDSHIIGKGKYNHDENDEPLPIEPNKYYKAKIVYYLFTGRQNNTLFYWIDGEIDVLSPFSDVLKAATLYMRHDANFYTLGKADGTEKTIDLLKTPGLFNQPVERLGFAAIHPQPFMGPIGFIPFTDNMRASVSYLSNRRNIVLDGVVGENPVAYKAGDKIHYRYLVGTGAFQSDPGTEFLTGARKLGLDGKGAYTVNASCGKAEPKEGILRVTPENYAFTAQIAKCDLPIDLPVIIGGLNPNWDAGIVYRGKNTLQIPLYESDEYLQRSIVFKPLNCTDELQHIPVMADGKGVTQIDLSGDRDIFIGNLLVCDAPELMLTVVDTRPGNRRIEAHNPTGKAITAVIRPAKGFTLLGDFEKKVTVKPGKSQIIRIK